MDGADRPLERGGLKERLPDDGRDMIPRWPPVGARKAPDGLAERDDAAVPRPGAPIPERPIAELRDPTDGAGPLSMADGRVLACGGAVRPAVGLLAVTGERCALGRTDGSGPRITPERLGLPGFVPVPLTFDRVPAVGPACDRRPVGVRLGPAALPRRPSDGRRVTPAAEPATPGLVGPVGRLMPRDTPEVARGGAVLVAVGRVRAGVGGVAVSPVRVAVGPGRVRTCPGVAPVPVRGSRFVVTGEALPVVPARSRVLPVAAVPTRDPVGARALVARPPSTALVLRPAVPADVTERDATERPLAAVADVVLAAVTEELLVPVRRGFSLKVVERGETTATVR